jgi:hypothetical protein
MTCWRNSWSGSQNPSTAESALDSGFDGSSAGVLADDKLTPHYRQRSRGKPQPENAPGSQITAT